MKPKILLIRDYISMFLLASMFFVAPSVYAQNESVSGLAKEENGLPKPSVNVVEKGIIQGAKSIVKLNMKSHHHKQTSTLNLSIKIYQYEERLH